MIKENFTYQDVDGNDITEPLYFHLTKAQIIQMAEEGWGDRLKQIASSNGVKDKVDLIKHFIDISVGHRKVDEKGKVRFIHYSEQELADWKAADDYDEFLFSLVSNPTKAANFINNLMPAEVISAADKQLRQNQVKQPQDHMPKREAYNPDEHRYDIPAQY